MVPEWPPPRAPAAGRARARRGRPPASRCRWPDDRAPHAARARRRPGARRSGRSRSSSASTPTRSSPTSRSTSAPTTRSPPAGSRTSTSASSTRRSPPGSSGSPACCPGPTGSTFSVLMCSALCATVARRRSRWPAPSGSTGAARRSPRALVAVSPLLIGNLVETRFDLVLAAILVWTLWAAATERWRLGVGPPRGGHAAQARAAGADPGADASGSATAAPRAAPGPALAAALGGRGGRASPRSRSCRPRAPGTSPATTSTGPLQVESTGAAYLLGPARDRGRPGHDRELLRQPGPRGHRARGHRRHLDGRPDRPADRRRVDRSGWASTAPAPPGDARLFVAAARVHDGRAAGLRQGPLAPVHGLAAARRLPGGGALRPRGGRRRPPAPCC